MENQEKKVNVNNWKLWVFTALPIAVFAIALIMAVISQFQVDKGNYVPALEVIADAMLAVALGAFFTDVVLKLLHRGGKRNIAAAIIAAVLILAVCAVLVVFTVTAPKVMRLEITYNNARNEWQRTPVTDDLYEEKTKKYNEAEDNFDAAFRPRNRMMQIAQAASLVGALTVYLIAKKPKPIEDSGTDFEEQDNSHDN